MRYKCFEQKVGCSLSEYFTSEQKFDINYVLILPWDLHKFNIELFSKKATYINIISNSWLSGAPLAD
jgi:hypothetical protein